MKSPLLVYVLLFSIIISGLSAPLTSRGFTARLIHRSSPESPYYDPHKSSDEIVAENHRVSEIRHYISDTMTSNSIKPASKDFLLKYDIGTPSFQTFGVPDTGSNLAWLQCATCEECYDQNSEMFDPRYSASYKPILCADARCDQESFRQFDCTVPTSNCLYTVQYMVGPVSKGHVAEETFTFIGDLTNDTYPKIMFGCGIHNTDLHNQHLSGIIGLGSHKVSLVSQMQDKRFSLCQSENPKDGTYLRFGANAELLGMTTPLRNNDDGLYHLILDGISVMATPLKLSAVSKTGFFLDTGSAYTLLTPIVYDTLIESVKQFLRNDISFATANWELCYTSQGDHYFDILPDITFEFRNIPMRLPMLNVWIADDYGNYCLAIRKLTGKAHSIFGMHQMRGYNIALDLAANELWISYERNCWDI